MFPTLSWNDKHADWSKHLVDCVKRYKTSMESGRPDETFLAGYQERGDDDKLRYWCELLIGIMRYESDFDPHSVYHEPSPLNVDSIGLFQLSYEDAANYNLPSLSRSKKDLEDPHLNIECGVIIFSHLCVLDRVVASGAGKASKGSARYWKTMRSDQRFDDIRGRVAAELAI